MSTTETGNRTYGEILSEIVKNGGGTEVLDAEMNVERRKVVAFNGALYINPTAIGQKILGFEAGDHVEVATTADEIRIRRVSDEGESEGEA